MKVKSFFYRMYIFVETVQFESEGQQVCLADGAQLKYKLIGGIIQENVPMGEATVLTVENWLDCLSLLVTVCTIFRHFPCR